MRHPGLCCTTSIEALPLIYRFSQIPTDYRRSKPVALLIKMAVSLNVELLAGIIAPSSERWKEVDRFNIFTVQDSGQCLNRFVTIQISSV